MSGKTFFTHATPGTAAGQKVFVVFQLSFENVHGQKLCRLSGNFLPVPNCSCSREGFNFCQ